MKKTKSYLKKEDEIYQNSLLINDLQSEIDSTLVDLQYKDMSYVHRETLLNTIRDKRKEINAIKIKIRKLENEA